MWLIAQMPTIFDHHTVDQTVTWIPQLGLDIDLRLDGFSALMVLLISGLGVLVCLYAVRYFDHEAPDPRRAAPVCSCCSPGRCCCSSWPTT